MKSIKFSKNVFFDLLNFYQMKNLLSLFIFSIIAVSGVFAQNEIWRGSNGEIQIVPTDASDNTGLELKSKGGATYIDFTSDTDNHLDYQTRIIGYKSGNMYFDSKIPNNSFIMQNSNSHGHLYVKGNVKSRSSLFLETGKDATRRVWEWTNRGLEYPSTNQPGKFMLNHFNGEKWLGAFDVKPYKVDDEDFFKMSIYGNTSLSVAYLQPQFTSAENGYDFIRLGSPQEYFGGLMYNRTNKSYGDGNDFTIFSYSDRDIYLRTSAKAKTVVPYGQFAIGTSNIPAGYKMAIDGKVICEELKVQLSQNWADYVFDEEYDLLSLKEVEQTIEAQGHLHNTPSAADLKAEGGIELSKMTINQQEKIEELFLHMIEMNKTVELLKTENESLKSALKSIK